LTAIADIASNGQTYQIEKMVKRILAIVVLISTISACKVARSLIELNKSHAKVYTYEMDDKEILFIPMHHLGKQEFYDDIKSTVTTYKEKGYRVYYELISTDFTTDSLLKDTIRRKVRKLKGFSGTYEENAEGSLFRKYVQQPAYKEMGTSDSDLRADVDYLQLINQWEKVNDAIVLDSTDLNTSFTEKFNKGLFYTKDQYNAIFIHYRNENLIDLIKSNTDSKILVLYGAGHRKDFKKRLKKH
jgi:hypothetical protein